MLTNKEISDLKRFDKLCCYVAWATCAKFQCREFTRHFRHSAKAVMVKAADAYKEKYGSLCGIAFTRYCKAVLWEVQKMWHAQIREKQKAT